MTRKEIGRYIVADPAICHGKLTFKGTRIMVFQVLRMAAAGMDWDTISQKWDGKVSREAIAEALALASHVLRDSDLVERMSEYSLEPASA